jgi:hypothetical protein
VIFGSIAPDRWRCADGITTMTDRALLQNLPAHSARTICGIAVE